MTHVKLISSLLGIFLFTSGLCGAFGAGVAQIFGLALGAMVILLVYFFIHEIIFGGLSD